MPIPRVLPKDEDPSLVKRNKRMLGQLLGTLEVSLQLVYIYFNFFSPLKGENFFKVLYAIV